MHYFDHGEQAIDELIEFIYDSESLQAPTVRIFQDKAIVCPKNDTNDIINARILQQVSGTSEFYTSVDNAIPIRNDEAATKLLYPDDYLNSMNFSRIPLHSLEVKIGVPIMPMRNLNLTGGLCNGTRMIVTKLLTR